MLYEVITLQGRQRQHRFAEKGKLPCLRGLPGSDRVRGQLIKRYLITGLLIWVPLAITAWVLSLIASAADQSLRLLPPAIHPHSLLGFDIPGAGIVVTLLIILATGILATNIIGQRLVTWWERNNFV